MACRKNGNSLLAGFRLARRLSDAYTLVRIPCFRHGVPSCLQARTCDGSADGREATPAHQLLQGRVM